MMFSKRRKGLGTLTSNPADPRLGHGSDDEPGPQNEAYLILSEEERAKDYVRPLRLKYVHWYYADGSDLPAVITSTKGLLGCGVATTMSVQIAETYAIDPDFYGSTYCVGCQMHRPVKEFHWDDGTQVGS